MHWKTVSCPFSPRGSSRRRAAPGNKACSSSETDAKRGLLSSSSSKKRRGGAWKDDATSRGTSSSEDLPLSIGEDAPPTAPWRIENIRVNGPPSEEEWWSGVTDNSEDLVNVDSKSFDSESSEEGVEFQNCGLHTWKQVQAAWRVPRVRERPPHPPLVDRSQVRKGLSHVSRQYELPGPMRLTDVIAIYNDIWD